MKFPFFQADDLKPSANTEDSRKSDVILFRFTPAHLSGAPDILVEAPITHPFLVKDKGMLISRVFTMIFLKLFSQEYFDFTNFLF